MNTLIITICGLLRGIPKQVQAMSNYLKELINTAESTCIEISATDQGLSVTVRQEHGTMSEPLTKSASFWIDKNEKDMVGRLKHFLNIVRKP